MDCHSRVLMLKQAPARYDKIRTNQPAKGFFLSTFPDGNSKQDFLMKAHPGLWRSRVAWGGAVGEIKSPDCKGQGPVVAKKRIRGVGRSTQEMTTSASKAKCHKTTRHEEHVATFFFGELYLAKFTQFPGGQAGMLLTSTGGAKPQSRSTARGLEVNWNNPAEVAVRVWKDWKNYYGEQQRKERKRMRDCGECSASGLLSSLLFSAVVLTRCWYQRICVFSFALKLVKRMPYCDRICFQLGDWWLTT